MPIKTRLTPDIARNLLSYNQETGILTWKPRDSSWFTYKTFHVHWNKRWAGRTVGTLDERGYLVFNALNKIHFVHRVAWLMFHGKEPVGVIDHINGNKLDNRINNLRDTSQRVNNENQRTVSRGKSLPLGVFPVKDSKSGKVFARIVVNKRRVYLGVFDDPAKAHEAYLFAKRELHEGCTI